MRDQQREGERAYLCGEQANNFEHQVKITVVFQTFLLTFPKWVHAHSPLHLFLGVIRHLYLWVIPSRLISVICPTDIALSWRLLLFSALRDQLIMMAAKSRFSTQPKPKPSVINHKSKTEREGPKNEWVSEWERQQMLFKYTQNLWPEVKPTASSPRHAQKSFISRTLLFDLENQKSVAAAIRISQIQIHTHFRCGRSHKLSALHFHISKNRGGMRFLSGL